eukprot:3750832-Pleurochrysis_carterae.AAC.4
MSRLARAGRLHCRAGRSWRLVLLLSTAVQAERQYLPGGKRQPQLAAAAMEKQAMCEWAKAHIHGIGEWEMCTYSASFDVYISKSIQMTGSFEGENVREVISTLLAAKLGGLKPVLVDVGGNIGMYSLAAAAAGIESHTFEPVPANVMKMMISAVRNGFTHLIHVYNMGASDDNNVFGMGFAKPYNQGSATHVPMRDNGRRFVQVPSVPLDSVLPRDAFPKQPVYLKMDIEGGECRALRGMRLFLKRANIIGAVLETAKIETFSCCADLMGSLGAFNTLHFQHKLCPYDQSSGKQLPFETLCKLRPWPGPRRKKGPISEEGLNITWPENMIWRPC